MEIRKAASVVSSGKPDETQLAKINGQARTPLTADEVYVFAVRLCDNQTDRDFERFSDEALTALAPMFIGKTGILDHEWSAERQVCRVFEAETVRDGEVLWLKAWAYMLRSEKNAELIREIDAGIKREVSVGCAMTRSICSVCGEPYGTCEHRKGMRYGEKLCTAILDGPSDAYEFSFVAVPAQREAGVVKRAGKADPERQRLEREAAYGRLYRKAVQASVVRMGLLLDLGLERGTLEAVADRLDLEQLLAVEKAFSEKTAELFPPQMQLPVGKSGQEKPDSAFLI